MSAITFNGSRVVSIRIVIPWRGVPFYDCDLDPELVQTIPSSGPAAITIGVPPDPVTALTGVIDPLAAGSFVATSRVRVLAGSGGWGKSVQAQAFAPTTSTAVYAAVAAQVLEKAPVDANPETLANGYFLAAGPASQVFGELLWWVDPTTGVTTVAPTRPPAVPDPSLEILSWDPLTKRAELSCDALVLPGTPLIDPRIGESPVIVRDVEQVFDAKGSRVIAWCSVNPVSRLQAALQTMVREFAGVRFLPTRRYRVVSPGATPTQWNLQAVDRATTGQAAPMPDALNITMWTGLAGGTAKLTPGSQVLLGFIDGDPSQAIILGYGTDILPLEVTLDATAAAHLAPAAQLVDVGAAATVVAIAGGADYLVPAGAMAALVTALQTLAGSLAGFTSGPLAPLGPVGTTLQGALNGLPPAATTKTRAT